MSNNTASKKEIKEFVSLKALAEYFKYKILSAKQSIILFGYNGTGKTRLSMEFKSLEQNEDKTKGDTLYYNAFTEDLFSWDNDLENDENRNLKLNSKSNFFTILDNDINRVENDIRAILSNFADFDFNIEKNEINDSIIVKFSRNNSEEKIKISRGEERIFILCFFLAIVRLVIDKSKSYSWIRYIYIDDPISSLDDNNAILIATYLAELIKKVNNNNRLKFIISTHHTLFFNVLYNSVEGKKKCLFLQQNIDSDYKYALEEIDNDTPFLQHIALLKELKQASKSKNLCRYHFNILRSILEKTASFHGYPHFSACIKQLSQGSALEKNSYERMLHIFSHGKCSLFEAEHIEDEYKKSFLKLFDDFLKEFKFNMELFK